MSVGSGFSKSNKRAQDQIDQHNVESRREERRGEERRGAERKGEERRGETCSNHLIKREPVCH